MQEDDSMTRIALVGPGSSFRGGIAEHTVALATRLQGLGVLTEHASWGRQFPRRLHPGMSDGGSSTAPDVPEPADHVQESRHLHWNRPDSWIRVARRLRREARRLVVAVSSPLQMPAVVVLARVFRGGSESRSVIAIVHNVLPHERSLLDAPLMKILVRAVNVTIVHSRRESDLATSLGARSVRHAALPFHPPKGLRVGPHPAGHKRLDALAFIGFVRPYKALDVLLEALSQTRTSPRLIVRGEFWEPVQHYVKLIRRLGLTDRVTLVPGYATAEEVSEVIGQVDALVLPYRSGTGSQQPRIGFACGAPAIVTDVGDLADQVEHDVNGLVTVPDDSYELALAIDQLYSNDRWLKLRRAVAPPNSDEEWSTYIAALAGK